MPEVYEKVPWEQLVEQYRPPRRWLGVGLGGLGLLVLALIGARLLDRPPPPQPVEQLEPTLATVATLAPPVVAAEPLTEADLRAADTVPELEIMAVAENYVFEYFTREAGELSVYAERVEAVSLTPIGGDAFEVRVLLHVLVAPVDSAYSRGPLRAVDVVLSESNGRYRVVELPRPAQVPPIERPRFQFPETLDVLPVDIERAVTEAASVWGRPVRIGPVWELADGWRVEVTVEESGIDLLFVFWVDERGTIIPPPADTLSRDEVSP